MRASEMSGAGAATFERVARDDPVVRDLYADFISETDGPLAPEVVDIAAEIAAGPPPNLDPPHGHLLLGRVEGDPAAIGGVRHLDTPIAEVKSMYVSPAYRGTGVASRLLEELHAIARARGCRATRLDTSSYLTAAIALYRSAGYREVTDYNGNAKADLWFERPLGGSPEARSA
jgi:ribosomal protein S18 acetylase RimI-like enzyme